VLPEKRVGAVRQFARRDALQPFGGFLPAAISQFRDTDIADSAMSPLVPFDRRADKRWLERNR
jgi:hypothetical protein